MTTTTAELTPSAKAVLAIKLVADLVQEAGEIPAGHLYALLNGHGCTLATFDAIVGILTAETDGAAPLVRRTGDLLTWNG